MVLIPLAFVGATIMGVTMIAYRPWESPTSVVVQDREAVEDCVTCLAETIRNSR